MLAWPGMAGERKKVAVVLGGGGAKGVAHIGVLKVLRKSVYRSISWLGPVWAIVGGLYAIVTARIINFDFNKSGMVAIKFNMS